MVRLLPILILLSAASLRAGELDLLRSRIVEYYTAAGAARTDPGVRLSLEVLEAGAADATRSGYLLSDGRWTDIDYGEVPSGLWSPWEHFRRVLVMARAWATPGQRFHHDPLLLARLGDALGQIEAFYGAGIEANGNWWFWTIGPALELGPALVLAGDALEPTVRDAAVATLKGRIGPVAGVSSSWSLLEGQNAVWSAMNHMMASVLDGDEGRMAQAAEVLAFSSRINAGGEGLQPDLSFHQHGRQLYTGGYGSSFALEVSRWQLWTAGTRWGLPASDAAVFGDFLVDAIAFSLHHNYFDPSVIGREVSKPWASGWNGLAALLHGGSTPGPRQGEIAAAAARMLESWEWSLPPELAGLAARVDAVPAWPRGLRIYPDSDFAIVRRPGWYASFRMLSTRTRSGESTNGEGLLGSRQADGRMHLSLEGDEYWSDEVWPAIDWSRLPGITVELLPGAASATYGSGTRHFTGGAGDGERGVLAMELAPADSTLEVRRAWFLLSDAIVSLASGVRATTGAAVETIVDQRPLRGGEGLVIDGVARSAGGAVVGWAAGEGIGYVFPRSQSVTIADEMRSGSWASLGTAAAHEVTRAIRSVVIAHGVSPRGDTAEYVLLPGANAAQTALWAAESPIEVLRNDELAAAVRDRRDGATGIVFWAAATVEGVSVDAPSIVFLARRGGRMSLALAEPARKNATIRLALEGRWSIAGSGAQATLVESSPAATEIEVAVSGGRTSTIELESSARRRLVRR
ncbi:MAG TPA: polysaccharide lyase family 8 super-sandwich domain-containing protein [Thermoanaerobaculia bacterium]|nr:polysaccharide lyase family 8 super-sandwich domain-containing protein [Thermoanaerobaculia bacterium]